MKNIIIVLVLAALAVGGYMYFKSDSQTTDATPTPTPAVSPSVSPSHSPSPKPVVTKTPAPTPTPSPTKTPGIIVHEVQVFNVNIENFAYAPATVTVQRGDVVVFRNNDAMAHTVTSVQASAFDSGSIGANASYTLATQNLVPGTYQYICTFHPSMRGTVIVQ